MGKMNLLKANWEGKVGQTVGAKWKDKSTIRTYTKPSNPKTQAQIEVRNVFGAITTFVAYFADQIKYLSALNTRGMSVRNAVIQANKAMIDAGAFTKADLVVSKGGLPNATGVTASYATGAVSLAYTKPVATNITEKAKIVAIVVDEANKRAWVSAELLDDDPLGIPVGTLEAGTALDVYYYIIDQRGSSRVGSPSAYATITVA